MSEFYEDRDGLKPCPFCGSHAAIISCDEDPNIGGLCVVCSACLACSRVQFGENRITLLTEAWNRRVAPEQEEPTP